MIGVGTRSRKSLRGFRPATCVWVRASIADTQLASKEYVDTRPAVLQLYVGDKVLGHIVPARTLPAEGKRVFGVFLCGMAAGSTEVGRFE